MPDVSAALATLTATGWLCNSLAPTAGSVRTVAQAVGSIATPLETLTGITDSSFATKVKIAAGQIIPGKTTLAVLARLRRLDANGTATLSMRLGPLGTSSDPSICQPASWAATANLDGMLSCTLVFPTSTVMSTTNSNATPNANTNTATDRACNTTVDQFLTWAIATGNALDRYVLINYQVLAFEP